MNAKLNTTPNHKHTLEVRTREWLDRIHGNSYFTSTLLWDGEVIHKSERPSYGYGCQHEQAALEKLISMKILPKFQHHNGAELPYYSLYQVCRDKDILLISHKQTVSTRRGLNL